MKKQRNDDQFYNQSLFSYFIKAGAPLFLFLTIIVVIILCVFPFFDDNTVTYTPAEYAVLAGGMLAFFAVISYIYPLLGVLKVKKQELVVHKRFRDRMENGLEQAKKDWFICRSGARLIVYHKDYVASIVKVKREQRRNESSSVTVYLTYIETCQGNREKITFLSNEDAVDFQNWAQG